jgi:hypothetical protein
VKSRSSSETDGASSESVAGVETDP